MLRLLFVVSALVLVSVNCVPVPGEYTKEKGANSAGGKLASAIASFSNPGGAAPPAAAAAPPADAAPPAPGAPPANDVPSDSAAPPAGGSDSKSAANSIAKWYSQQHKN